MVLWRNGNAAACKAVFPQFDSEWHLQNKPETRSLLRHIPLVFGSLAYWCACRREDPEVLVRLQGEPPRYKGRLPNLRFSGIRMPIGGAPPSGILREVAQSGRALRLGRRGRRFESSFPDQFR